MPPLTPKNAALAASMTGLDRPGPVRADQKDELMAATARLASFLDRLDQELPPELLARMQSETPQRPN